MTRVPLAIRAALVFAVLYVFFRYGIAPVTEFLTGTRAPLPASLVSMYAVMTAAAILLYLSVREDRWERFVKPVAVFLRGSDQFPAGTRLARRAILVLVPVASGWWGYARATRQPQPPADPPGIHFNLPIKYASVTNPLPWTPQNIREGGVLYTRNCAVCHGDAQDGNGLFARAWQPRPANFRDTGTIAQLDENYLFWRIKEGAPGLPSGTIGYRSAMPPWADVLSDDEIWKIVMFEYTNAGVKPAKRE